MQTRNLRAKKWQFVFNNFPQLVGVGWGSSDPVGDNSNTGIRSGNAATHQHQPLLDQECGTDVAVTKFVMENCPGQHILFSIQRPCWFFWFFSEIGQTHLPVLLKWDKHISLSCSNRTSFWPICFQKGQTFYPFLSKSDLVSCHCFEIRQILFLFWLKLHKNFTPFF